MNRGLPFLVAGVSFLTLAFITLVTSGPSTFTVWIAVGAAMLAVGFALSQAESDEPDDDGRMDADAVDPERA
ncbi:hypothetical protein SAMN04487949_0279 [Halogranum gelatinilyticum]|uniref:Uncharacterized protein n=1 Tax=Halogranum gelatinilyticum TaxID=660521 RepID=A0A1G9P8Z1_9EURY|nr:hypothetical protein [Halogranum gelatinilyticum]SDL94961.1 hypothetical protein SAMN04487949_0279 [Halogranum gelatinilyticum]